LGGERQAPQGGREGERPVSCHLLPEPQGPRFRLRHGRIVAGSVCPRRLDWEPFWEIAGIEAPQRMRFQEGILAFALHEADREVAIDQPAELLEKPRRFELFAAQLIQRHVAQDQVFSRGEERFQEEIFLFLRLADIPGLATVGSEIQGALLVAGREHPFPKPHEEDGAKGDRPHGCVARNHHSPG